MVRGGFLEELKPELSHRERDDYGVEGREGISAIGLARDQAWSGLTRVCFKYCRPTGMVDLWKRN